MKLKQILSLGLFALAAAACGESNTFKASLTAAEETMMSNSTATGSATFTLDGTTLTWAITHTVMSPTAAHIHDGAKGAAGMPIITLDPINAGSITVTEEQITKLRSGNTYVNIHDAANMAGAIRGQVEEG